MNNMNNNYVSLDVIANKIYKNPLLKDLNFEDIIDFSLSVIKIAKVRGVYKEEGCYLAVKNNKALLPKEALNLKTVDKVNQGRSLSPMTMSSFSLANQIGSLSQNYNGQRETQKAQYKTNGRFLNTSFCDGEVFITFDTIMLDDNDIPMIPDSESLLRAIEAYIKIQAYTILVDIGKMSERSLNRAEQEYYFNIGKFQSEQQGFQNEDEMESFLNGWKRTFLSSNEHDNRYGMESRKENLRRI